MKRKKLMNVRKQCNNVRNVMNNVRKVGKEIFPLLQSVVGIHY